MLEFIKNLITFSITFGIVFASKFLVILLALVTGLISLSIIMVTVVAYSMFQQTEFLRKLA
jgi:hypothetical protein